MVCAYFRVPKKSYVVSSGSREPSTELPPHSLRDADVVVAVHRGATTISVNGHLHELNPAG